MRVKAFVSPGWFGLRLGHTYWKLRDVERHPLLYSERNRIGYLGLARVGTWEFGVSA